ncbi:MAG: bifunctional diaminohydroxyphosphoribosylaminopyrimidine deaminase/5-amino-6-(5-phosphoribosylamino)uracil reductase RibD [Acidimicrobiia bacterium]|nr:bifunctional diaminohydroxyphosphoribosylaminopyrimidine deaminase/5-amino-6-(5-phosphoribosylamino)uracil reductase RibD [Acidimicrobiia bacterium]NNF88856.1 bifunctional diaminohydroxyphosphoribosylaminopyrimidine deaminase/5-amino-6-(5-phosphoribosylamino)uracil reductase RibD [Acidimicrobiia bacterium]NNL13965.1 bifunctional diaminohydroxyphosphoribosylaminopyrimidine deaminase/5-amino-6-(5-phosphoribosylamino)uracil reductase RibD [Acidimicrobiia bacterium]
MTIWSGVHDYTEHMRSAIEAALDANPHPNPRVGSIVLDPSGSVVGRGIHREAGEPHSEQAAIAEAGDAARGGTLIVTLEPCNHHGRTPPCTEAILDAGIETVVIGAMDPDTRVAGGGVERLREAGVEVTLGLLSDEVEVMDPAYFHHRRTGRPRVTLKAAMTLDGQVAARDGTSQWITSIEAREDGHRLRAEADAVMVGAGTVLADDPELTVRLPGYHGRQPIPVVIAGKRPFPNELRVIERNAVVFAPSERQLDTEVVVVESGARVDLDAALRTLGDRGIVDLLVEGGPILADGLLEARLIDRCVFYLGAKLAAGVGKPPFNGIFRTLEDAIEIQIQDVRPIGPDVRVEATLVAKEAA